jgi:hypothetical protein
MPLGWTSLPYRRVAYLYLSSIRLHRAYTQIDYFNKRRTLEIRQKMTLEAAERQRNENPNNAGR